MRPLWNFLERAVVQGWLGPTVRAPSENSTPAERNAKQTPVWNFLKYTRLELSQIHVGCNYSECAPNSSHSNIPSEGTIQKEQFQIIRKNNSKSNDILNRICIAKRHKQGGPNLAIATSVGTFRNVDENNTFDVLGLPRAPKHYEYNGLSAKSSQALRI